MINEMKTEYSFRSYTLELYFVIFLKKQHTTYSL